MAKSLVVSEKWESAKCSDRIRNAYVQGFNPLLGSIWEILVLQTCNLDFGSS